MTCGSCAAGMLKPRCYPFEDNCDGCSARAVAALGLHLDSQAADPPQMTIDYRRVLKQMFGDRAKEGHARVLEWAGRIRTSDKQSKARGTA